MADRGVLLREQARNAEQHVIGAIVIDDRCMGQVMSKLREEDFFDGTCRATFRAMRKLKLEGRPIEPITLVEAMSGGDSYMRWLLTAEELTGTSANAEVYADIVLRTAAQLRRRELAEQLLAAATEEEEVALARKISISLSAASRMPRMTGAELAHDFLDRMSSEKKPEYLPWGIPTADRSVYAELGDLILLGGYSSSGKTLLSILMALTQAKRYKVGYYTLETQPEKMADRMFAHLSGVPLGKIKKRDLGRPEWDKLAAATNDYVKTCPFDIIRAARSSVEDIAADAVGHGYQIVYVDYLQLIEVPGIRKDSTYAAVSAVSRGLKLFAQSTNTAVVALAQFSRAIRVGKGKDAKMVPPSMQSFRDSGQIEQDADAAFLLWASDPDDNSSNRILKLGKNKEGRRFKVTLSFQGETQTMVELAEEPDYSVAAKYSAQGRAAKQNNRQEAKANQVTFQELTEPDPDNPFEREERRNLP